MGLESARQPSIYERLQEVLQQSAEGQFPTFNDIWKTNELPPNLDKTVTVGDVLKATGLIIAETALGETPTNFTSNISDNTQYGYGLYLCRAATELKSCQFWLWPPDNLYARDNPSARAMPWNQLVTIWERDGKETGERKKSLNFFTERGLTPKGEKFILKVGQRLMAEPQT